jgi:signal transduction histidine kinase
MLIKTQSDGSAIQAWALHTKEVIAKVAEIDRTLLEGYSGVQGAHFLSDSPAKASVRHTLEAIPRETEELWQLVSDNTSQRERTQALAQETERFLAWLAAKQNTSQTIDKEAALASLSDGAILLKKVRELISAILWEEGRLDRERMDAWRSSGARQIWTTAIGGLVMLAATFALALLFLRNVVNRLALLRDNAQRLADGKSLRAPLAGHDEIAEVDHAFHHLASSLEQQKQENDMFVYSVSHDLRSPLINLEGFSRELSASYQELHEIFDNEEMAPELRRRGVKALTAGVGEPIRFIQSAVARLGGIISGLLRLSRAGRVEYRWQSVDLPAVIQRIVEALHDSISAKKAEVVVGDLPQPWGDPIAVEQIFANLIDNAVQYLDPRRTGHIEVSSADGGAPEPRPGFRVYYVKDNGLGIPEAYHTRVFTAFSRLHADVSQGEGVGLALVRRMVERHGGKIWVESRSGVGSTFFVELPSQLWDGLLRRRDEFTTLTEQTSGD